MLNKISFFLFQSATTSQSSKENTTMAKMVQSKTVAPQHPSGENHTQSTQPVSSTPATSNSSFTLGETYHIHNKVETAVENYTSEQKSVQNTNINTKNTDSSSCNKNETNPAKGHRKKGRSRIAANFSAVPPPGTN